ALQDGYTNKKRHYFGRLCDARQINDVIGFSVTGWREIHVPMSRKRHATREDVRRRNVHVARHCPFDCDIYFVCSWTNSIQSYATIGTVEILRAKGWRYSRIYDARSNWLTPI